MFSGKHFRSDTKAIIFSVWSFLNEVSSSSVLFNIDINISDVDIRLMTGVTSRSIAAIVKEGIGSADLSLSDATIDFEPLAPIATIAYRVRDSTPDKKVTKAKRKIFSSPKKRGPNTKRKLDLVDDFTKCAANNS